MMFSTFCQALTIDADVVWALIDRSPVVARSLLHILSTRVRRNNLTLVQSQVQQRIHERDALNDSLTSLYNRRWVESNRFGIVERSARARESLALLMIDTDHFKCVNDKHGHLAGAVAGLHRPRDQRERAFKRLSLPLRR